MTPGLYAMIGAAATLGGVTRMTGQHLGWYGRVGKGREGGREGREGGRGGRKEGREGGKRGKRGEGRESAICMTALF